MHCATHCKQTATRSATYCNTLQHTASHYNTMQHPTSHCSTLQHTATHCNTRQHLGTHCNTHATHMQQTCNTHCNELQLTATHRSTLQHTLQHTAIQCNTLQHSATATVCSPPSNSIVSTACISRCSIFSFGISLVYISLPACLLLPQPRGMSNTLTIIFEKSEERAKSCISSF